MLDASSLVDTIFREHYSGAKDRSRLNIADYCLDYESRLGLSRHRSLLYQTPPVYIETFKGWYDPDTDSYVTVPWWQDYNALKHDRIKEYRRATLSNAIHSLGALHQVISLMEVFKSALLRRDLISFGDWGKKYAFETAYSSDNDEVTILVETELFATPVGARTFPDDMSQLEPYWFSSGKKLWRFFGPSL